MPVRPLNALERAEAALVFGASLDYARVRVWEAVAWPNWVGQVGALWHRSRRTTPNAISLGNAVMFPFVLDTTPADHVAQRWGHFAWLMHELTHQWQFQHWGWRYLWQALAVQVRQGPKCYHYWGHYASPAAGLQAAHLAGRRWASFNPEQQGDLVRHYYLALKQGRETAPWQPFIAELQPKG